MIARGRMSSGAVGWAGVEGYSTVQNETGTDLVSIHHCSCGSRPGRPSRRVVCSSPSDLTNLRVQASSP